MGEIVKAVEIVFENLEYVRVPVEHIGAVNLQNVSYSIGFFCTNSVKKHLHTKSAYLQIKKSFRCDIRHDKYADLYEEFKSRIFNPDIVFFRIHYMDGSYEDIYVSWEDCEDSEYKNRLQSTTRDAEGNIIIEIG